MPAIPPNLPPGVAQYAINLQQQNNRPLPGVTPLLQGYRPVPNPAGTKAVVAIAVIFGTAIMAFVFLMKLLPLLLLFAL